VTASQISVTAQGHVAPGFERVAEEFARNFAERGELGGAFAAYVDGVPVVDLWGGLADRRRALPWRRDGLVGVFSGTKGLVATCLLILIERGQIALDAPVCRYWPEFAANGKQDVLVWHAVSHRAGLPGLTTPVSVEEATDDVRMAGLLARQAPAVPVGRWHCYCAMTFGWLCGELVRRVDGRSVGRFFAEEVARPLGLELWIGLPEEHESRVAVLEWEDESAAPAEAARDDPIAWSVWRNPPRFSSAGLAANRRCWHAAEIPATNAIGSVRSIARLYGCLARGGQIDDLRLLTPATVELGRRCLTRGHDPYLDESMAFGVGFQLQNGASNLGSPSDAFGHGGAGGSIHGAWPSEGVGFSYATNLFRDDRSPDPRAQALLTALREAISSKGVVAKATP
jgi:CubicO group peptidase (beta-lactamase class C family)